jgi:tetratricopeptide (TPR) repeat protein
MTGRSLTYRRHDAIASRLVLAGSLLMAAACLIVLVIGAGFGRPLLYSVLPRGWEPVAPAQPNEVLVLVTALSGQAGENPTPAIDSALLNIQTEVFRGGYYYMPDTPTRLGRLRESPASEEQARVIAQRYRAAVVLWGTYDADSYTVHVTLREPPAVYAPASFASTLPQGAQSELSYFASLAMALAYIQKGDFTFADFLLDSLPVDASQIGVDPLAVAVFRAETALERGRYSEAYDMIRDAWLDYPSEARLYVLLADIHLRSTLAGEQDDGLDEALAALDQALALDPSFAGAYALRGSIFQMQGNDQAALADVRTALALGLDYPPAYRDLGDVCLALGEYELAVESYQNYLALRPDAADRQDVEERIRQAEQG